MIIPGLVLVMVILRSGDILLLCCQVLGCFIESLKVIVNMHPCEIFNTVKFVTVLLKF